MSRKTKAALSVVGVLIGGVALFLALTQPPESQPHPAAEAAGIVMRGYDEGGNLSWEARAVRGDLVNQEGTLIDVTAEFFDEQGTPIRLRAERLVRKGHTASLDGGVVIHRDDGLDMETEHVTWNEDARTLRSDSTILTYGDSLIRGEDFEYDLRSNRATLVSVTATFKQESSFLVTSDRAGLADDRLTLEGSVHAESESENFRCDRLEATLDGASVTLLGSVIAAGSGYAAKAEAIEIRSNGRRLSGGVFGDVTLTQLGGEGGA